MSAGPEGSPSLAVPPTSSGERSVQTLIPWVEKGFMWQGWEKWGDASWKPGVSQEKMPPWRGGWVSPDLQPLEEAASKRTRCPSVWCLFSLRQILAGEGSPYLWQLLELCGAGRDGADADVVAWDVSLDP